MRPVEGTTDRILVNPLPQRGGIPIQRSEGLWDEPLWEDSLEPDVLQRLRERAAEQAREGVAPASDNESKPASDSPPGKAADPDQQGSDTAPPALDVEA